MEVFIHGVPEFAGYGCSTLVPATDSENLVVFKGYTHRVNLRDNEVIPVSVFRSLEEDLFNFCKIRILSSDSLVLVQTLCTSTGEVRVVGCVGSADEESILGSKADTAPEPGYAGISLNADIFRQATHVTHGGSALRGVDDCVGNISRSGNHILSRSGPDAERWLISGHVEGLDGLSGCRSNR